MRIAPFMNGVDRRPISRSGVTLLEVLVAIFVMGIGLLALLTLFPLGALRMASSFRMERACQCTQIATSVANMKNLRGDSDVVKYFKNSTGGADATKDLPDTGPSNPVFVDARGALTGIASVPTTPTVAGNPTIPRISPSYVTATTDPSYFHYFQLLDDITFQRGMGVPKQYGNYFEREPIYSWAYLLQRPRQGNGTIVNTSVCVFERRTKATPFDTAYTAALDPSKNMITISFTTTAPEISAGGWVLDTSKQGSVAAGRFYRVTGARTISSGSMELDVQTPLIGYTGTKTDGEVVIMDGLIEVFDIGPGR